MAHRTTNTVAILTVTIAFVLFSQCADKNRTIGLPLVTASAARANHPGKKILIVVSGHEELGQSGTKTGYWLSEVTHFYDVAARHGFEIDFVSPLGAPAKMDPGSDKMSDPLNRTFVENAALKSKLDRPLSASNVDPKQYAAIYYAGGHGTMWDFPDAADISALASKIYEQGGVVSAVCHGPAGILNIKLSDGSTLIRGKKLTGFANLEETLVMKKSVVPYLLEDALVERGGVYSRSALPFKSHVVTDGRLVTGQNPSSAAEVGEALMDVLARQKP